MVRFTSPNEMRNVLIVLSWASIAALYPSTSHAYLDPGTGSYSFQMLLAIGLAAAFIIKLNWKRLKSKFSRVSEKDDDRGNS